MEFSSSHTYFSFLFHLCHFLSSRRARTPSTQGERQLMLDRQSSHAVDFRVAGSCCNKPYRPFLPWWTGSRLSQEVTVQVSEQATSPNFGPPAALTSISSRGIAPWGYTQTFISAHFSFSHGRVV